MTKNIPYYELEPGVFEIDEFDCASIFVIVGTERALVLDTGVGIGDLKWVIENRITDKPYDVVITHNHGDHIGGAGFFDKVWVHEKDMDFHDSATGSSLEFRRDYARLIAAREDKSYNYNVEEDIIEWEREPAKLPLKDGQEFDLGGRTVTIYHCPGHTEGECVALDDLSRILFLGDACNRNLLLYKPEGATVRQAAGQAAAALSKLEQMKARFDKIYNSHHDYRGFGSPLRRDTLDDAVSCLNAVWKGSAEFVKVTDPLSPNGGKKTVAQYGAVQISCINGDISE